MTQFERILSPEATEEVVKRDRDKFEGLIASDPVFTLRTCIEARGELPSQSLFWALEMTAHEIDDLFHPRLTTHPIFLLTVMTRCAGIDAAQDERLLSLFRTDPSTEGSLRMTLKESFNETFATGTLYENQLREIREQAVSADLKEEIDSLLARKDSDPNRKSVVPIKAPRGELIEFR